MKKTVVKNEGLNTWEYEYLFSFSLNMAPTTHIMACRPDGAMRMTGLIEGGKVWGDRVNGKVLPYGGDWSTATPDGISHINVTTLIETDDGAQIYLEYTGKILYGGKEGFERAKNFDFPPAMYFSMVAYMETNSEKYTWLNDEVCFGIGKADFTGDTPVVQYDIYAHRSLPGKD